MLRILLLLCAFLFISCGKDYEVRGYQAARKVGLHKVIPDTRSKGIDEALLPYVRDFEAFYGNSIGDITVNFGSPTAGKAASCHRGFDVRRQIIVSKKRWLDFDDSDIGRGAKEFLMFHELGHCVLNKGHSSSGLMIPTADNEVIAVFLENRDEYIADLFR